MGRYICEVKKDNANMQLELIHAKSFATSSTSEPGVIQFSGTGAMYEYFNKYCISEDSLLEEVSRGNNLFQFLFFILLFIVIGTIIWQLYSKNGNSSTVTNTSFGRFSF